MRVPSSGRSACAQPYPLEGQTNGARRPLEGQTDGARNIPRREKNAAAPRFACAEATGGGGDLMEGSGFRSASTSAPTAPSGIKTSLFERKTYLRP